MQGNSFEEVIDNYKIFTNSVVGKGNQGTVYNCKLKLNQNLDLCAKVIQKSDFQQKYLESEKNISQFVQKNQNNENLVKIHHVKETKDKLYIIMEKCQSNLKEVLLKKKTFNDLEIQDFLNQFLKGYKLFYDNNIIHRDIKPDNILINNLNENMIYKLTDFGIAKKYKANDFQFSKIGTPAYSAPEINNIVNDPDLKNLWKMMKQNQHSKSLIDIWSLGIILYQMIHGKVPFENGVENFLINLKQQPLKLQGNSQYIQYIEKMLLYNPGERMTFDQLIAMKDKNITKFPINNNLNNFNYNPQNGRSPNFINNRINFNNIQVIIKDTNQIQNAQLNFRQQQITQPQIQKLPNQQFNFNQLNTLQNFGQGIRDNQQTLKGINPNNKGNQIINKSQIIREYLQYLLNTQKEILKDQFIQCCQQLISNKFFTQDQLEMLSKIYPFKIDQVDNYESKTLNYFYCLLSSLYNPLQNIYTLEINSVKSEIKKILENLQVK